MDGNSACVTVCDYFPYFYFQAPAGFLPEQLGTIFNFSRSFNAFAVKQIKFLLFKYVFFGQILEV